MEVFAKFDQKAFMEQQDVIFQSRVSVVIAKASRLKNNGKKVFWFKTNNDLIASIKKLGANLKTEFQIMTDEEKLKSKQRKQLREQFHNIWEMVHGTGSL